MHLQLWWCWRLSCLSAQSSNGSVFQWCPLKMQGQVSTQCPRAARPLLLWSPWTLWFHAAKLSLCRMIAFIFSWHLLCCLALERIPDIIIIRFITWFSANKKTPPLSLRMSSVFSHPSHGRHSCGHWEKTFAQTCLSLGGFVSMLLSLVGS